MTAAALTASAVVQSPPSDGRDADLIRLCTEYVALTREKNRLSELAGDAVLQPYPAIEAQIQAIIGRRHEMQDTIAAMPATTPAGVQAKAEFVLHFVSADADHDAATDGETAELLSSEHGPAHSLALDLLRGTVLSPTASLASATTVEPSSLLSIAFDLERMHDEIIASDATPTASFDVGQGRALIEGWWDIAGTVLALPLATPTDLVALARICRVTWKRTEGDDCDLRDELDQKLSAAVIGGMVLPGDDADLLAACAAYDALEDEWYASTTVSAHFVDDPREADYDAAQAAIRKRQEPVVERIAALPTKTLAGHQARARSIWLDAHGDFDKIYAGYGAVGVLLKALITSLTGADVQDSAAAQSVTNADAELVAACADVRRLGLEVQAFPGDKDREDEYDALVDRWSATARALGAAPVRSLADAQMKARLLVDMHRADQLASPAATFFEQSDAEQAALLMLEQLAGQGQEASDPDAAYITLCDHLIDAWRNYDRISDQQDALPAEEQTAFDKEHLDPAYKQAGKIFDQILAAPMPTTLSGLQAAARAAIVEASDAKVGEKPRLDFNHVGEQLAWRVVEQLASWSAAPAPDPDAELKAACAELIASLDAWRAAGTDIPLDSPDPRRVRQRELLASILNQTPITLAGHQLRARAVLEWNGGMGGDGEPAATLDHDDTWPVIRDLIGSTTLKAMTERTAEICANRRGLA